MIPAKYQTLKINSSTKNLRLIERLIDDVCQVYGVNEEVYGNMLIAVTEAVNNAIHHGNQDDPDKFVRIGFESDEDVLVFSIADEGKGFDPTNLPDPTDPANLDKVSGRGVFLMSNLTDSIKFEDNGRKVLLGFRG
jgi:serine/threonine-protein kinase RsbW